MWRGVCIPCTVNLQLHFPLISSWKGLLLSGCRPSQSSLPAFLQLLVLPLGLWWFPPRLLYPKIQCLASWSKTSDVAVLAKPSPGTGLWVMLVERSLLWWKPCFVAWCWVGQFPPWPCHLGEKLWSLWSLWRNVRFEPSPLSQLSPHWSVCFWPLRIVDLLIFVSR